MIWFGDHFYSGILVILFNRFNGHHFYVLLFLILCDKYRTIVYLHFFLSSYLLWPFFLRAALFEEQIYLIDEDDQTDDYAYTDTRQLDVSGSIHRG